MREHVKIMFREEEINQGVQEVADRTNRDYGDTPLYLIYILKGGAMSMCKFAKQLTVPVSLDFMPTSSYNGTESSGVVRIAEDLDELLESKHVLTVEGIIDTGHTFVYLIEVLGKRGPKNIHLCTLLDKPERHVKKQVTVDYVCFTTPDRSVVGYGPDYDQKYRNYPYIGVVEFEDDKA